MLARSWALVGAALMSSVASAQLFSQAPAPVEEGGAYSYPNQIIADNFVTSASEQVNHITFWGSFFQQGDPFPAGGTHNFTFKFYEDGADLPGTAIVQQDLTASFVPTSFKAILADPDDTVYQFDVDWSGPTFFTPTAGTQYWLTIFDPNTTPSFRWHNAITQDGRSATSHDHEASWSPGDPQRRNMAFTLNPVPEPASMATLALGALALLRRRRKSDG